MELDLSQLEAVIDDLNHDLGLLQELEDNQVFRAEVQKILQKNFTDIWATRGAAINESWDGHTLVQTGNLRNSLTTNRLQIRVIGNRLYFESNVSYAPYVNDLYRFYGITPTAADALDDAVSEVLKKNGKLRWS